MRRILAALALTVIASSAHAAHARQQYAGGVPCDPKATPAYAALVLRKAAVEAELESLSGMFTDEHPGVGSKRFELNAVRFELEKLQATESSRVPKLSDAYGRLVLRKVAVEAGLNDLLGSFTPRHPEVLKKRAELLALERELEDILR
jgi:uncharacterized protein involved in exopolysaccharide biosynthesis